MWTIRILAALGVDHAQADRQVELLRVVVEAQRRQDRPAVLELDLGDVDLGDEEAAALGHIRPQHRLGALGDVVALAVQPLLEVGRVAGAEDDDVVLADRELGLDLHPQLAVRAIGAAGHRRRLVHDHTVFVLAIAVRAARILLPILDQARRGQLIQAVEHLARQGLDLLLLQDDGHRNDHGEVFRWALVVVLDRQHRAGAVAHHRDHGRVVEKLGVGAADVETTKRIRGRGGHADHRARERCRSSEHGSPPGPADAGPCCSWVNAPEGDSVHRGQSLRLPAVSRADRAPRSEVGGQRDPRAEDPAVAAIAGVSGVVRLQPLRLG